MNAPTTWIVALVAVLTFIWLMTATIQTGKSTRACIEQGGRVDTFFCKWGRR